MTWAWATLKDILKLGTTDLPDGVINQDFAAHLYIECPSSISRNRAKMFVGYLLGTPDGINRELSADEKEFIAAIFRKAAEVILNGEITFQDA